MISLAEALAIHTELITATGGSQGVRDRGGLEAALARPFASFGGADLYPKPIDKDAAVLESVVKNHPFVDGNKRTGYTLARLTLMTYDLDLRASDDEEYDMVILVATGQLDVDGIRAWMKGRVVPSR
ncbi:MAG: type II toxin-antitoxin system death-on-curing family toxin [Flavobacteriales bacterium]|nr:type II toxin-antitoxin system death-on-curing family toxin [Flavobacteriales bacterium]MCC6937960.1 type II toxin-antitoxin system death-on-curing family toxin [Flavobacteriales bacterium]